MTTTAKNKADISHEYYMARCVQTAKNGLGTTFPNPMVGSIVVHNGKIIGEGYTSPYGGAHAEVNAIASVENKSLLKEATLYVSLEPCSHYGKTPPCADMIIAKQIPKVVIGCKDPHEKVAGKGIQKLQEAGLEVVYGVLEDLCKKHHKRFLTFHEKKRPLIILKWAETADGFIAPKKNWRKEQPEPYWITNTYSKQLVHQWRSQEQGILVGTQTVLEDNPRLNTRLWAGASPVRIVLDRQLKIPEHFHLMDNSVKTIVFTEISEAHLFQTGIQYEPIDFSKNIAEQICAVLHQHQLLSFIIEGGARTLQTFIDANLWDEARVFTGPTLFKAGIKAPLLPSSKSTITKIASDTLKIYHND
ncbi:bifunctional diaminohydroxyphosphoribosylaminopyrimidine deaminase/5-amino-6-(5-phosphoribosylamino)uracil reductase RibD [Spongiimicrobium salis]|uniref:bifunctional diaminohydroxyphosphoribosylaminopyrimidine deaminase/5-amino-6-(5-phosphoribosylamino)uracil reductase RibD n=1 Tax=Spongiimicrobium salis TaxID=1667022 RepID=UPI00374D8462